MNLAGRFGELNWAAIILATTVAFLLGAIWYSNPVFGKKWMQEIGLTEESASKTNMTRMFATTFVLQFISATALGLLLGPDSNWFLGLHSGFLIGLLWITTSCGITYLFEQRTMRIFLINSGYFIVAYTAMGTIIGAWS